MVFEIAIAVMWSWNLHWAAAINGEKSYLFSTLSPNFGTTSQKSWKLQNGHIQCTFTRYFSKVSQFVVQTKRIQSNYVMRNLEINKKNPAKLNLKLSPTQGWLWDILLPLPYLLRISPGGKNSVQGTWNFSPRKMDSKSHLCKSMVICLRVHPRPKFIKSLIVYS